MNASKVGRLFLFLILFLENNFVVLIMSFNHFLKIFFSFKTKGNTFFYGTPTMLSNHNESNKNKKIE